MRRISQTGPDTSSTLSVTLAGIVSVCCLVCLTSPATAAEFTVTTTADSGAGSLRQAIEDANAAAGGDTITFDIPQGECTAAGVCEIVVATPLPEITGGGVIDGATQPRYGTAPANVCATSTAPLSPRVQVTGDVDFLLRITSSDRVTVRGLVLGDAGYPVRVDDGGLATIQCNLFGVSVDGQTRFGFGSAVCISCSGGPAQPSIVGTDGDGVDDEREGNVFAAGSTGININYSNDHVIAGNLFGVRQDGVTRDDVVGPVYMRQSASNNRVGSNFDGISDTLERNVFAHGSQGVRINSSAGSGDANLVLGNWFGVDAEGGPGTLTTAIYLSNEGQDHVVARNRIEGAQVGIFVEDSASLSTSSTDNCLIGNEVGLRHAGSATGLAAALNWWGAASGPSGLGGGTGDSIEVTGTGSVDFDPWLTDLGLGCTTAPDVSWTVIPAAAAARGAAGSFFVTDLEVHNRGGSPADVVLKWLPRDTDNTSPTVSATFTLDSGSSRRFANVLDSVFGLSQVVGALLVESSSDRVLAMSRTFNQSAEGTFGQSLPGVPTSRLVTRGERVRVLFMDENDDYRSNLGLVNGSARPITVQFELFDADGNSLGSDARALPAWGNTQINRLFGPHQPIEAGYVDVWTDTPDGTFTCYGSVLDNLTSDPTTVFAE